MIKSLSILFMGIILIGMINQESFALDRIVILESNDHLMLIPFVLAIASLIGFFIWSKSRDSKDDKN